jgi:hypothetical protein
LSSVLESTRSCIFSSHDVKELQIVARATFEKWLQYRPAMPGLTPKPFN